MTDALALSLLAVVVVWLIAVWDLLRRRDLPVTHKLLMLVVLVVLAPLAIVYVLGRPTGAVRRSRRTAADWRSGLVRRLEELQLPDEAGQDGPGSCRADQELLGRIESALTAARPSSRSTF